MLGAGGSARRLIWVSAPIESRIKAIHARRQVDSSAVDQVNGLSKTDCTTFPPTPLKLFWAPASMSWLFWMLARGAWPPPP